MPRKSKLTDEIKERIRSMSEQRYTQREIAEMVGCSIQSVRRVQQDSDIPASNRYSGGALATCDLREVPNMVSKPEQDQTKPNHCGVVVAEKNITFVGERTQFLYGIGTTMDSVRITTNNNNDIVIEAKDLVAFGNELLDIAEKIYSLQKIPW